MAAAVGVAVIGVVSGLLGIVGFARDLIPKQVDHATIVRIGIGLSSHDGSEMGGHTPNIALFDVVGRKNGRSYINAGKRKVGEGAFTDIKIKAPKDAETRQSEYISVSQGGDNAVCIAYISMTWPDGGQRAWYGDVARACAEGNPLAGIHWYYSHTIAGDDDYKPACVWIDGDGTNGINHKGMGIHITDFTATRERTQSYIDNPASMCGSWPRFHMYEDLNIDHFLPYFNPPLEFDGNLADTDLSKVMVAGDARDPRPGEWAFKRRGRRDLRAAGTRGGNRTRFMEGRLVRSKATAHSAVSLCGSASSLGPDFVSLEEGMFCDMTEKQLWPLCDEEHAFSCFDTETNDLRPGTGLQGRDEASGRFVPVKSYTQAEDW